MKTKNDIKLKVGTLFSGIGAFEEALKQLGISHDIQFACDNGEIELIPLDDLQERKEYKDFEKRVRSLSEEEKIRHKELKDKIAGRNEVIRRDCYEMKSKADRTAYVDSLYRKYEGDKTNWMRVTYLANHPELAEEDFHTDVRFLKGSDYTGKVDILVGGSPCQSFSTYGKKQGLEDARGTLFYDYARVIKECNPKVFIYENVAGLKSRDKGQTWDTMLQVWRSLNYELFPEVLNAKDYNHPQLRRRLFLVGIRRDVLEKVGVPFEFPEPHGPVDKDKLAPTFLEQADNNLEKNESAIDKKYYLGKKGFEWITTPEKNKRKSRVNQDIIGCETANQQDNWIGDLRIEHPLPIHYEDERIYIGKYDFQDGNGIVDAVGRKMTPRECLNLMGFGKDFKIPVSDKIAYRQAGNSIVVPVLKEITKQLLPYLK